MKRSALNVAGSPGWVAALIVVAATALSERRLAAEEPSNAPALASETSEAPPADYLSQVKPLLKERCYACHGALKQAANLRLDTASLALKGGDSGPAVTPADAVKSLLVQRVSATDVSERMPPEHEGEPFTPEQIALLRNWIAAGAEGPAKEKPESDPREHWAFQPIVRPAVPVVRRAEWVRNPIDAFIAQQHERRGLTPAPEASRETLLRRLTFDLIGLPPTPEEIAAIRADKATDWYERAVQRLLVDPRHGERWARHWMDVWRYSDWWGLGDQLRRSQKHIWRWRDWIVESLNDDAPYDQMVRLMLAADELAPNDLSQLRAGGFLARSFFVFNRHQWMDETVEHVGKGFLGLTFNCAKCHDHKYDPISQVDYYRLRAFFEPYHVRTDFVPGEANATRDGLPRPFDAVLDAKTYRLIRGNEASPDESLAMEPGVPEVIGLALSKIQAIELPLEAAQPERRTWVVEAHRQAAGEKIAAAEAKLAPAREKLAHAEKAFAEHQANAPTPNAPKSETDTAEPPATQKDAAAVGSLAITEKFDALDPERWKLFGGDWVHEKGRLQQKQDGAQEAVLRWTGSPPRDFDATLKLTILGGSRWRSAGIAFDCSEEDPTKPTRPNDTTQFVYLSAFEGGPKVQAAWRRGGQANYPQDAMQARSVPINEPQTLRVQVRGDLINVSLNGEPALAWRTPLERRDGSLQFFTFDALVVVHEVSIAALAPDVPLRESNSPGPTPASPPGPGRAVEEARLEWELAEQSFAAAQAEQLSLERRTVATLQSRDDADKTLARSAALAQAEAQVAAARVALTQANLKLLRAASDKREGTENDVAKASESLDKAIKKREAPGDQFTRLVGAEWSATRFKNSGADDPPMAFPSQSTGRRTALAEWITDRRNPLTARVAVNHIWMRHFGEPLVATVFDFGRKGQAPSHPELLDWLACELIESGWSMKHVHRLIVESSTYRMSSSTSGAEANRKKDPDNLSLWRRTPMRLESQAVRDALLALAGTLDETRGGPSVPSDQQAESKRRSLYFFHSNNDRNQFLTTFDEALVTECYRREQSIVPQQALALTNSRLVLDAARPIAERLTKHLRDAEPDATSDDEFIRTAFLLLLAVESNDEELAASRRSLDAWRKLPEAGQGDDATHFARSNLVWVLLNHNDFVTVR